MLLGAHVAMIAAESSTGFHIGSEKSSRVSAPDAETIEVVQAFLPEVLREKATLRRDQAGLIVVASIPVFELYASDGKGGASLVRAIRFPRWEYRAVLAGGDLHPLTVASEALDRVRFYLSLAAGTTIPVGAYVYTAASHAPTYRGYENLGFGVLNPIEVEELSDDAVKTKVEAWYRSAQSWLDQVPVHSILDTAIMTRMHGLNTQDRRAACLASLVCLEILAKAHAVGRGWLELTSIGKRRIRSKEVDQSLSGLLRRWQPDLESHVLTWRRIRNQLVHPFEGSTPEQMVWDLTQEVAGASRTVLLGILAEATSVPS